MVNLPQFKWHLNECILSWDVYMGAVVNNQLTTKALYTQKRVLIFLYHSIFYILFFIVILMGYYLIVFYPN